MRTLSIISTPFQLFCLKEYFAQNKIKDHFVVALVENKNQKKRLENLSKLIDIDLDETHKVTPIKQYFKIFFKAMAVKKCDELIIGNYFSNPQLFFLNNLKYHNLTIIDDGITSNFIDKYYSSKRRLTKSSNLRKLFYKIFRINVSYPTKFKLFTLFDITSSNFDIEKNNLKYIKSLFQNFKRSNKTYIIGQPFVDLNILSEDLYLSCLNNLKLKYENILYIAGRKEKDETLIQMKKKINLNFIKPDINIEHLMIEMKELPVNIIGFTSSALYTLDKIYNHSKNNISISSYKIPERLILSDNAKTKTRYPFQKHYDQIKQNGIQTIV